MKRVSVLFVLVGLAVFFITIPAGAVEFKVSGQINRMIVWADNGEESDTFHADNDNSSTRFRFKGSEEVTDGIKVGVVWETQFESNTSSKLDTRSNPNGLARDDNSSTFSERKLEAYFDTFFGKVSIGQGDGAANGTSEVDLSGTSVIMYSGVNDTGGDFEFVREAIDPATGNQTRLIAIDKTRNNFDGLSRNDRFRYDTPKFGPLTLSASITNGNALEGAARISQEFDGFGKIAAAVGYVDTVRRESGGTPLDYVQIGASASILHTSGLNLTVAWGRRDPDAAGTEEPENIYGKLGFKKGIHAVAVEYGITEDLDQKHDESENYGLAYVLKPWKGVELYAAYREFSLDRRGVNDIEDISQAMIGTRVKFW
jgi:predicted porin